MKPKIWMYWDDIPPRTEPPEYIKLCWETIRKHCEKDFYINLVTTENVKQFLPDIDDTFFNIAQINNKSNYLRYHLLCKHGGIWLDSDLIIFKSLLPIMDILKGNIDLIATASPTLKYGEPECGILISKPNGSVISRAVSIIEYQLSMRPPGHIFPWGSLGPKTIRNAVKGRMYHHLDCKTIMPISSWEDFKFGGKESIDKYCNKESYGVMLFHQMFKQSNSPFLIMNRQQLLDSPTLLGQIFRKAINL